MGALACSCSSGGSGGGSSGPITFQGQVAPLSGFNYDTGLEPTVSPAQAELKLSGNGNIVVSAGASVQGGQLTPAAGSGSVQLDLHFVLAGRLKVTSTFKSYDGPIPGLMNVDIEAKGSTMFDPFLIGSGSADVSAPIPATQLPDIPLGTIPGNLKLAIGDGSVLKTSFQGTCMNVQSGTAKYQGSVTTSGTLVLKASIALSLPPPLDKSVDLPDVNVNIPATPMAIDLGSQPAPGASDTQQGMCGAAAGDGGTGSDASSDAGSDGGTSTDGTVPDSGDGGGGDDGGQQNDADAGSCSPGGASCTFSPTATCCSGFCNLDSPACALQPGTIAVSIDGQTYAVTNAVGQSGMGTSYTVYAYFTGPGLGPNTRLVLFLGSVASGCSGQMPIQGVQYQPDDGSNDTYFDDGTASCGLTVTSLPPGSAAATFDGTLDDNQGKSVSASVALQQTLP